MKERNIFSVFLSFLIGARGIVSEQTIEINPLQLGPVLGPHEQKPMTEALTQTTNNDGELSFAELFEMEENSSVVNVGDVTMGTIIGVVDGYVLCLLYTSPSPRD